MEYWETVGLPKSGFSICQTNCQCIVVSASYTGENLDKPLVRDKGKPLTYTEKIASINRKQKALLGKYVDSDNIEGAKRVFNENHSGSLATNGLIGKGKELSFTNGINRQNHLLNKRFKNLDKNYGYTDVVDGDWDFGGKSHFSSTLFDGQMDLHKGLTARSDWIAIEESLMKKLGKKRATTAGNHLMPVYRHERGHQILWASKKSEAKGRFIDLFFDNPDSFKKISEYAATDLHEAFAESFSVFTSPAFKKGMLDRVMGEGFESILDEIVGNI